MISTIKYDTIYRPYYFYKDGTLVQCNAPDCGCSQFVEADNDYVKCIVCGTLHQAIKGEMK